MNPAARNHGLITALHSAAIEERVAALVSIIENPGQRVGAERASTGRRVAGSIVAGRPCGVSMCRVQQVYVVGVVRLITL